MDAEALTRLYGRYVARSKALLERFKCPLPLDDKESEACCPAHKDGRAYLVVRVQLLWAEFSRQLVIRSAAGRCRTRTGRLLSRVPIMRKPGDYPRIIRQLKAGPGTKWDEPSFAIQLAYDLSVTNYNQISLGLGSATISEIKCVRNFIVHPNVVTNTNYLQLTRNRGHYNVDPDTLISDRVAGGATLFETWVEDLLVSAWNAVQ